MKKNIVIGIIAAAFLSVVLFLLVLGSGSRGNTTVHPVAQDGKDKGHIGSSVGGNSEISGINEKDSSEALGRLFAFKEPTVFGVVEVVSGNAVRVRVSDDVNDRYSDMVNVGVGDFVTVLRRGACEPALNICRNTMDTLDSVVAGTTVVVSISEWHSSDSVTASTIIIR